MWFRRNPYKIGENVASLIAFSTRKCRCNIHIKFAKVFYHNSEYATRILRSFRSIRSVGRYKISKFEALKVTFNIVLNTNSFENLGLSRNVSLDCLKPHSTNSLLNECNIFKNKCSIILSFLVFIVQKTLPCLCTFMNTTFYTGGQN